MRRKAGWGFFCVLAMTAPMLAVAEEKPAAPSSVEKAHKYSVTATVVSTDLPERKLKLKFPNDKTREYTVKEDVDLTKVKVGQKVKIDVVESVALSIQRPEDPELSSVKLEEARKKVPDGVDLGRQISANVKITAIDQKAKTITIKGPEGDSETVDVTSDEGQAALKTLKVGDEIRIVYTQAVAVRLLPNK